MMSGQNPYSPPEANIQKEGSAAGETVLLPSARTVSASRGWGWIAEGFAYFKRSPLGWILGLLVGFAVVMGLQFVPVVGPLIYMLIIYPLIGGVMLGCHAQSRGEPFEVRYLAAALNRPGKLLLLSLVSLMLYFIVVLIMLGPEYLSLIATNPTDSDPDEVMAAFGNPDTLLLRILGGLLLSIPVAMALWFSPALIAIHDVSVADALKRSFTGCLKNILPFLIFGLLALIFYILAIIPLLLGLLVFFPTFTAATYLAYRDIFTAAA